MTARTRKRSTRPAGRGGRIGDPLKFPLPQWARDIVLDRIDEAHRRGLCHVSPTALASLLRAVFPEDFPVDGRPARRDPESRSQPIEGP